MTLNTGSLHTKMLIGSEVDGSVQAFSSTALGFPNCLHLSGSHDDINGPNREQVQLRLVADAAPHTDGEQCNEEYRQQSTKRNGGFARLGGGRDVAAGKLKLR
jgi:hypothetical protein